MAQEGQKMKTPLTMNIQFMWQTATAGTISGWVMWLTLVEPIQGVLGGIFSKPAFDKKY